MNIERWQNDTNKTDPTYSEKNLRHCHFAPRGLARDRTRCSAGRFRGLTGSVMVRIWELSSISKWQRGKQWGVCTYV